MTDIIKNKNAPDIESFPLGLKVSPEVELKHVRQVKGEFNQKPAAGTGPKSVSINHSSKVEVDKEDLRMFVFLEFSLVAKLDTSPDPVVTISASFLLLYELREFLEEFTDEHFKQFAELNGTFNAWPYWREYVQSATSRMGLPGLTVPVLAPFKPKRNQE